jgi:diadenylate cyclase
MNYLSQTIAGIIIFIGEQTRIFWDNLVLLNFSWQQIALDIVLVTVIFYFIFSLIKGSRAVHVLIGLSIVLIIYVISKALQLVAMSWLLDRIFTVVLVAIPIIFQKELRMGLERLGQTKIFQNQKARQIENMIFNIVDASKAMAEEKIGALIVLQKKVPLKEYIDTGVPLNAIVSKELLLSVFQPKMPLHDGAVIIADEKIKAASCILPHSFEYTDSTMGTRHKAALGLSENTDASVIVVSEEKGHISFSKNGKIERNITPNRLQVLLIEELKPVKKKRNSRQYKS